MMTPTEAKALCERDAVALWIDKHPYESIRGFSGRWNCAPSTASAILSRTGAVKGEDGKWVMT
jgi:hypothetical protein